MNLVSSLRRVATALALVGTACGPAPQPASAPEVSEDVPVNLAADTADASDTAEVAVLQEDIHSFNRDDLVPLKDWSTWGLGTCGDVTEAGAVLGEVVWSETLDVGPHPLLATSQCDVVAWSPNGLHARAADSGTKSVDVKADLAGLTILNDRRVLVATRAADAQLSVYDLKSGGVFEIGALGAPLDFPTSVTVETGTTNLAFAAKYTKLVGRHGTSVWQLGPLSSHCSDQPKALADFRLPILVARTLPLFSGFYACGVEPGARIRTIRSFIDGQSILSFGYTDYTHLLSAPPSPLEPCVVSSGSSWACGWTGRPVYNDDLVTLEAVDAGTQPFDWPGYYDIDGIGDQLGRGIGAHPAVSHLAVAATLDAQALTSNLFFHKVDSGFETNTSYVAKFAISCSTPRNPFLPLPMGSTGAVFFACPNEVRRYTLSEGLTWAWKVPSGTVRDIAIAGDRTCVVIDDGAKQSVVCLK